MQATDHLRVQYDFRSGTVLLQCRDRSHVLAERFRTKESAERAAVQFARENWEYTEPTSGAAH
ncbi:hypothetical protein ACLE20_12430 [Rhizobium sp. YIM 134829]|uniref:hypothetical protein n=1 Tax=Rhizobium sp. YIM 134829 TaxID=3390453 RepID=UPI003979CD94